MKYKLLSELSLVYNIYARLVVYAIWNLIYSKGYILSIR